MSALRAQIVAAGLSIATAAAGCERGCLASWFGERNAGGTDAAVFALAGTDCSGGLARCVGGRVEISRDAHLSCGGDVPRGSPERASPCECPWETVGRCSGACAYDGAEVVAAPEVARRQLCRSPGPVARPPTATESLATVCVEAGVRCVDGAVRSCARPGDASVVLAVCVHGCESHVSLLDPAEPGQASIADGVATILCRRDPTVRR